MVVGSAQRFDPRGRALVLFRATCTRDLPVRDVAHQHVAERVFALVLHRRSPRSLHELLPLQSVQTLIRRRRVDPINRNDRSLPEDLAEDGPVLQHALLCGRQSIQPRGDHALNGLRQRQRTGVLTFLPHLHVLLGVERVAVSVVDDRLLGVGWEELQIGKRPDELQRLVGGKRRE